MQYRGYHEWDRLVFVTLSFLSMDREIGVSLRSLRRPLSALLALRPRQLRFGTEREVTTVGAQRSAGFAVTAWPCISRGA